MLFKIKIEKKKKKSPWKKIQGAVYKLLILVYERKRKVEEGGGTTGKHKRAHTKNYTMSQ